MVNHFDFIETSNLSNPPFHRKIPIKLSVVVGTSSTYVRRGQNDEAVLIDLVQPGDILLVRPGEQIPVDEFVTETHASFNEAMLKGENLHIANEPGSKVLTTTLTLSGRVLFAESCVGKGIVLGRIFHLVQGLASSLESRLEHPLPQMIVQNANQSSLPLEGPQNLVNTPGQGIRGTIAEQSVIIVNALFIPNQLKPVSFESFSDSMKVQAQPEKAQILISIKEKNRGTSDIAYSIRQESKEGFQQLPQAG